jgi:hypothetical protein
MVAVNDRAYLPGLRKEFPDATRSEISRLRRLDRRARGITEADEQQARVDVAAAQRKGRRFLIRTSDKPTSAHSDFLWTAEADPPEDILIVSPKQWQYSGGRVRRLVEHKWPDTDIWWSGGSPTDGYFCISDPGPESQEAMRILLDW